MYSFLSRSAVAACASLTFLISLDASEPTESVFQLDDFIVSAGPLARMVGDFASPFTVLGEEALHKETGGSLGAVLDGRPGVAATSFGAGASRPVIRGFDGPRVRILDSGIEMLDVSDTSPDHAVSVEPLLVERIEILRGPSNLLYGSSAIGGVVNVIGREIPREPVGLDGYDGAFEARHDGASDGETVLGYGTVGGERWAIRVTGLTRVAEDYEIPARAEIRDHGGHGHEDGHEDEDGHGHEADPEAGSGVLRNSFVETDALSVGGTWFFGEQNHFGAAISLYESLYGVPGHEHAHGDEHDGDEHEDDGDEHEDDGHDGDRVAIDLKRKRFDAELALFDPFDWIEAFRLRFGYTDYEHTEMEGGVAGTVFEREGWEFRAEAAHRAWGPFDQGVFGGQAAATDFSAEGAEAFAPTSRTRDHAVFLSEHVHGDRLHFEVGARLEHRDIDADAPGGGYDGFATSLAAGVVWEFDEHNSLALSVQRSERHPTSVELYAEGPHLATGQYERGDPGLGLETAYGVDLGFRHRSESWEAAITVFHTYFEDYIFAANEDGDEKDGLPVFVFTAVNAAFSGLEIELTRIMRTSGEGRLEIGLVGDCVRAENRDDDEDLPRIPPARLGGRARLTRGAWETGFLVRRAFEQEHLAPGETETDGYTELEADLGYTFDLGEALTCTVFIRGENLLDEEIRHHSSFLKDVAPLPGRSFTLGGRLSF